MTDPQPTEQPATPTQVPEDKIETRVVAAEMYNRLKLAKFSALALIMVSIISPLAYIANTYIGLTIMVLAIAGGVWIMRNCDQEINYLESKYKLTLQKKFTFKPRG